MEVKERILMVILLILFGLLFMDLYNSLTHIFESLLR